MTRDDGVIVNIGSISASVADPSVALYNASKAFVHGLIRSIAVDHRPSVRANTVCPGWITTGMAIDAFALADDPEGAQADAVARHPVRRLGRHSDIAVTVALLASGEAALVTGQSFTVDGRNHHSVAAAARRLLRTAEMATRVDTLYKLEVVRGHSGDGRRLVVVRRAGGRGGGVRSQAGAVPDAGGAERPDRDGGAGYSLSSCPHDGGPLTVTVLRTVGGYASKWIRDNLRPGRGSGCCPRWGSSLLRRWSRPVALRRRRHHADYDDHPGPRWRTAAHCADLRQPRDRPVTSLPSSPGWRCNRARLARACAGVESPSRLVVVHWPESVQGLPTQEQLQAFAAPFATYEAFVCGPASFMKAAVAALKETHAHQGLGPDAPGIAHAVNGVLVDHACDIVANAKGK